MPTGVSISAATGEISGTATAVGNYSVTITVADINGGSASTSFEWAIVANEVPVITAIDNQLSPIDLVLEYTPTVTDADDTDFVWSSDSLPTGLSIDEATGVISGTPTIADTFSVTLSVADGSGGSASVSFEWIIEAAPAIIEDAPPAQDAEDASEMPEPDGPIAGSEGEPVEEDEAVAEEDDAVAEEDDAVAEEDDAVVQEDEVVAEEDDEVESSGSDGAVVAAEDDEMEMDTAEMEEQPSVQYAVLQDHSVINTVEAVRQSLLPVLSPVMENGFSRLSELLDQAGETPVNRSSVGLKFAFADQAAQQISDIGAGKALGDAVSNEVDSWLPDGWAVWSRGEVSVGKLKAAQTDADIDIEGNHFALGADKRIDEQLTLGGFLQSGKAKAQVHSSNETKAISAVLYGSFILSDEHYLQAAIGYSSLDIDMQRISAGVEYAGSRSGDSTHLLVSAARRLSVDFADVFLAVEAGSQTSELDAYKEKDGPRAYHYMAQRIRHNHIGVRARLNETYDLDFGALKLTGELGYQNDLSKSGKAQAYLASDEMLIFTHDVGDNNAALSSSHGMVSFGADLTNDQGWTYSAKGRLRNYKTGNIASVNLQAAYRF